MNAWPTSISVAISASRNRLFWNEPIGWPKAVRSLTYVERPVERAAGGGDRGDGDRQPLLGEVGGEVSETLALLAEPVGDRNAHVGEEQLGGVLGVHPDLVEVAAALEALHAPLEDRAATSRRGAGSGRS